VGVVQQARFLLRQDHHPPSPIREPFEHPQIVRPAGGVGRSVSAVVVGVIVVGVVLAMVYERQQSLMAWVAAHATFNLIGFVTIVLSRR